MKTTEIEINGQISVCLDDENGNLTWMSKETYSDYLAAQMELSTKILPSEAEQFTPPSEESE